MKNVFKNIIDSSVAHKPANLSLLAKCDQIRHHKILRCPHLASNTNARLHLIKNQKNFVFIAKCSQLLQELGPKVVVSPLPLDGFNDKGGNIIRVVYDRFFDLPNCQRLLLLNRGQILLVEGEFDHGIMDARPFEFGEVVRFRRVSVCKRKRVAGPSVESPAKVNDLSSTFFRIPFDEILSDFPIKRSFDCIFVCQGPPIDKEEILKVTGFCRAGKCLNVSAFIRSGRLNVMVAMLSSTL